MAERCSRVGTVSPKPLPRQNIREENKSHSSPTDAASPLVVQPDCPVCLQPSIHPVKVPCGHVFCFLCVKGASNQSQRCALCRQAIPPSFFESPTLLDDVESGAQPGTSNSERYAWFYEGRNGWWQYDERTNHEIEEGYRSKKRSFELLIAGYMYIIDLDNMSQMRRSDPSRRRRIKRDLVTALKKGIAGLKIVNHNEADERDEASEEEGEVKNNTSTQATTSSTGMPGTPDRRQGEDDRVNIAQSPDSSPGQSGDQLSQELESLSLSYGEESSQDVIDEESFDQNRENDAEEVLDI